MKPLLRRRRASKDIEQAAVWYAETAGLELAERFLREVDAAFEHIGAHPGTGSPRYGQLRPGTELRFWTLRRFPYAVFYVERQDDIQVIRVLHQASDIPAHLDEN
ncbi:MAG: type II toxin-antitoxin system RelE/ParE family toxin [Pseudomonadota bacterium]